MSIPAAKRPRLLRMRPGTVTLVGLTTATVYLFNAHTPYTRVVALATLAVLIGFPIAARRSWFWLAVVAAWTPSLTLNWMHTEDHIYVGALWGLALALSVAGPSRHWHLDHHARWMIGTVFLIATVWKAVSPDYLDTSLFQYKLLFDGRFRAAVSEPVGALDPSLSQGGRANRTGATAPPSPTRSRWSRDSLARRKREGALELQRNVEQLRRLKDPGGSVERVPLRVPERLRLLACGMTVWTLAVEALLALAFLAPPHWSVSHGRHVVLIAFLLTTYSLVPVLGFGCLFASMGIAQCRGRPRLRYTYLAIFLLLPLRTLL